MTPFDSLKQELQAAPKTWLITGVAGFIGSNLLEALLKLNQRVVGLDNFSTGHQRNLDEVRAIVSTQQWMNFHFIRGDIRNLNECRLACDRVDYVLHQAALGSVPRSIEDPVTTNQNNIDGYLNMLVASRDAKVKRFIYAASSSTYGDHPDLPKIECNIGKPLSPYAVTKLVNEIYAEVFSKIYDMSTIGLRYFNVFGPRQDPNGVYAAVIPKWILATMNNENIYINGDGQTSRDFCFVDNVIQANILAAMCKSIENKSEVLNVAVGERTTLNQLHHKITNTISKRKQHCIPRQATHLDFREGDVRHSLADINKARNLLAYTPSHNLDQGLIITIDWFLK